MKVLDLIEELQKIEDKSLDVVLSREYGEEENGDPINVESVAIYQDCVAINN